jgi:cysteine synthase
METLTIYVPNKKSELIRQILKSLGVDVKSKIEKRIKPSTYAKRIKVIKKDAEKMLKDISQDRQKWG